MHDFGIDDLAAAAELLLGEMGFSAKLRRSPASGTAGNDDAAVHRCSPSEEVNPAPRSARIHPSVRSRPSSRPTLGS